MRLLVTRELERLAFRKGTYWDLKAQLETSDKAKFTAELASGVAARSHQARLR